MGVKLGQKWAVKDGNLLASNQVGSRFFNKEFDFSRASNGTYVDRDGLLKTAELYNKIEYSQDFQSGTYGASNLTRESSSVISPDGFENAYKLIPTAVNGVHILSNLTINNAVYSVFAKQGGYKRFRFNTGSSSEGYASFDLDLGQVVQSGGTYYINSGIEDYGNGWYRCYLAIGATSGTTTTLAIEDNSGSVTFIGDDVSGIYLYGMQAVEGTEPLDYQYTNGLQGLPRISFEDGVGHLLLEPQRTNLVADSEDFSQWNNQSSTDEQTNETLSPNGEYDASKLIENNVNAEHKLNATGLVSIGTEYTISIFAKAAERSVIALGGFGLISNNEFCQYDLTNGTAINTGTTNNASVSIEDYGNGWYRCIATYTATGTANIQVELLDALQSGNGGHSYLGDGSSGVYLWGAQVEEGYATSYIKTEGTATTRLADVCNNSGSAQDFNSEEGVLYAEVAALEEGQDVSVIALSDNSLSNRILIAITGGEIRGQYVSSGHNNAIDSSGLIVENFNKIACVYTPTTFKVFLNGSQIGSTISITTPVTGLSKVAFDRGDGGLDFNGKTRNLQVFTEALSDAELQKLTT